MQKTSFLAAGAAWLIVAGAAVAATVEPTGSAGSGAPGQSAKSAPGYLATAELPDAARALGPPPGAGTGQQAGDLATYEATRKLEGTARWALAARDAGFGPGPMLRVYSCALGVTLTPKTAPRLYRLLDRLVADSEAVKGAAKAGYKRPRPFVEHGGRICVPDEAWLRRSYSYPSGHSTFSWTAGLVLEEIAPDRAGEVMARARSYGDSRVVCGVHYESDVQAGRAAASILFSAVQHKPAFRADLARAGRELARLRTRAAANPAALTPDAQECAIEAEAAATPVW
jgi:acid phosphatase (class A)